MQIPWYRVYGGEADPSAVGRSAKSALRKLIVFLSASAIVTGASMNERIAISITKAMGTMWCAYAFLMLALLPLVVPSTETWVQYLSSALLQLVALPILAVGQTLLGRAAEARAIQDHAALMEILEEIRSGSVCHVKKNGSPDRD